MQDEINNRIDQGICAEKAVDETCGAFIDMFSSTGDELTMQRATDIKDIRVRLLRILTNAQEQNIEQISSGYTMAVDRGNSKVSYLYSSYNPAVIRSIRRIIKAAKDEGIKVGMCGEAAADPMLIPLLVAFGLDEYSVSTNAILETRASIAKWTKDEACNVADKVMKLSTEKEIFDLLKTTLRI